MALQTSLVAGIDAAACSTVNVNSRAKKRAERQATVCAPIWPFALRPKRYTFSDGF